jgi:hypothetical protein
LKLARFNFEPGLFFIPLRRLCGRNRGMAPQDKIDVLILGSGGREHAILSCGARPLFYSLKAALRQE